MPLAQGAEAPLVHALEERGALVEPPRVLQQQGQGLQGGERVRIVRAAARLQAVHRGAEQRFRL